MKKLFIVLWLLFNFQAHSAQKKYDHERKHAAHLALNRMLPTDAIEMIKELVPSRAQLISIRVHFEPLYRLIDSRWFSVEVTDDMLLDDLHSHIAAQVNKRKENFKLVKRGVLENTPMPNDSKGTLKDIGIDGFTHIRAEEKQ